MTNGITVDNRSREYRRRILDSVNWAILCLPGTPDCPSLPDPSVAGAFICQDPGALYIVRVWE